MDALVDSERLIPYNDFAYIYELPMNVLFFEKNVDSLFLQFYLKN